MQTIIDTLLIVISNIPGIDETVYANIYDIELTDKTVFVIVPGDISENITAYLVNGSILLMSKVMLVLKSKYMETNIVITSKDNIKEFSLDNCSGVYNVIKYKRIYKREYCGDSYEGMFVKSVNGLHGEVFLDIPLKISDLPNDVGYITEDELPIIADYTDKFNLIDSSILDVSSRVHTIESDYVKHDELPDYTVKFNEIDSSISNVSTRVHTIESDYVKHDELPIIPDYTDKLNEIDSSISNVSTRVHTIENDYTTREYVDLKISEIVIESGVSSVNGLTGDVVIDIPSKVSDLLNDSNFISRQEAEDEFSKKADVYTKGQIDQKFIQTAQRIVDVSTNVNNVSSNLNNEVNRLDLRITEVSSNIPSLTDYAKTIYVDQKVQDVSTFVSDNFAKKSDIPTDYVRESEYLIKIQEIESDISGFVDSSFVESENEKTLNSAKSYTDGQILLLGTDVSSKISKLNVSINNEFNRIWDENYVKHDEIADFVTNSSVSVNYAKKSEITDFITRGEAAETYATNEKVNGLVTGVSSVNSMTGDVVIDIPSKVSDLLNDSNFISKQEAEGAYAKKDDVYTKGQIDQKFIQTAKRIIDVSTNLNNEVSRLDLIITNVSSDITTINSSLQSYNTRITDNELKNTDQDSSISRLNTSVNTLESSILTKQEILVSGTNIKTINGNDILGEGNIEIQGGGDSGYTKEEVDKKFSDSSTYVNNNYVLKNTLEFEYCNVRENGFNLYGGKRDNGSGEVCLSPKKIADDNSEDSKRFFGIYQRYDPYSWTNDAYIFYKGNIYTHPASSRFITIVDENNRLVKYSEVYTKSEIDTKLGDINTILERI